MENVCTSDGNVDIKDIRIRSGGFGGKGHFFEKRADFGGGEGEPAAGVDVRDFGSRGAWGHVRDFTGFVIVGGDDLHRLDTRIESVSSIKK